MIGRRCGQGYRCRTTSLTGALAPSLCPNWVDGREYLQRVRAAGSMTALRRGCQRRIPNAVKKSGFRHSVVGSMAGGSHHGAADAVGEGAACSAAVSMADGMFDGTVRLMVRRMPPPSAQLMIRLGAQPAAQLTPQLTALWTAQPVALSMA